MKANANSSRLVPSLKWWGGKSYLAKKFIALMPRHRQQLAGLSYATIACCASLPYKRICSVSTR